MRNEVLLQPPPSTARIGESEHRIKDIIVKQDSARFDRAHFQRFGDYSLIFEIVNYVETSDYAIYMNIQQAVNFGIFRQFSEAGIVLAYPAREPLVSNEASGDVSTRQSS